MVDSKFGWRVLARQAAPDRHPKPREYVRIPFGSGRRPASTRRESTTTEYLESTI